MSLTYHVLLLAVAAGDREPLSKNLSYQGAGMIVVLAALGLLAVVVAVVGSIARRAAAPRPAPAARPADGTTGLPPETLAVIAAAVAVTLQKPHRIVQIRATPNAWLQAWSLEGRRQIFHSHTVR